MRYLHQTTRAKKIQQKMFLITMATTIITLLWSILLFVDLHNTSAYIWLNLSMMFAWISLCIVFVYKQLYTRRNIKSTLLKVLIDV